MSIKPRQVSAPEAATLTAPRVAIQGYEGSFHEEAARTFFGRTVETIPCATFREVIQIGSSEKQSDGAVMAIENSIAGSILPNYTLLQKSNLSIVGEVYLQINQHLLVNPGVALSDVKEVRSHPMALLQCMSFLEKYDWKLVETEDTALSAKYIKEHKSKHTAAVAGKLASDLYNLDILSPNIHTLKNNYTRFLVLQKSNKVQNINAVANKASAYFEVSNDRGSLAKVLSLIAKKNINLSKLQSMPVPGSNFNYGFYADMEFEKIKSIQVLLEALKPLTNNLKVFGLYQNGYKK
ncbi:MAG: Prephenate dehydratase [Segetibacter sp.]|nr:Prephenate dehydratase [Segetibacter sp.]